ncbi:MAG: 16S rRNA (uracil(1498)-N(3))-methyltransferase [Pirellulales bacterium]
MTERYFVELPIDGPQARLTGGEAHHLAHVMRAKPGHLVTLFDGQGAEFSARVERVGRAEIELAVLERADVNRELPQRIVLGVTLPKGDRQRWLVEKATEVGVARLVPLVTEHSGEHAAADRLRRTVIEACKQCRRNQFMEIAASQPLGEFLAAAPTSAARLFAHPGGDSVASALARRPAAAPLGEAWIAVGPEGGFSAREVEAAHVAGWRVVDLGPRILRVETAAIALAAAVALGSEAGTASH